MKKWINIMLLLCTWCMQVHANGVVLVPDSVAFVAEPAADTIATPQSKLVLIEPVDTLLTKTPVKAKFQPDPDMAVWLAAVVPGLGQIYNRQYWKLPIVYGGAMGLAYAITWNNQMYIDYRKAYLDLIDPDPTTNYYLHVLKEDETSVQQNRSQRERTLKDKQETYLRNRDLSIIFTGVLYLLTLIDAYVDAQMADYDISPDLSLQVAPAVLPPTQAQQNDASIGLRCKLKF